MNKTIRILSLTVLIAALAATAQDAEAQAGERWSLTPTLGFSLAARLGSLVPLANTADVPGVKIGLERRGPEAGLWLGRRLGRGFEIQAGASRGRAGIYEDVGIGFSGIPLGKSLVAYAVIWAVGARLLYGFGAGAFEPYVAAGFGITTLDAGELGSKARPAVEIGAGIRTRLTSRLKAVLEIRDVVTFFRTFEDFRVAYIMIYTAETAGVQHRPGARLGLSLGF